VHTSGRGAGGHCFIKDFEAFRKLYESNVQDIIGTKVLDAQKDMNLKLLVESGKDLDIVRSVYGIEALH
jgi:UDP-glucose 6-dehydrogenase